MWRWWWWKYRRRGNKQPRHHSGNLHCDRYWHFRRDYEHGDDHAHGAVAHTFAGHINPPQSQAEPPSACSIVIFGGVFVKQ